LCLPLASAKSQRGGVPAGSWRGVEMAGRDHVPLVHSRCTQIYVRDVAAEAISLFSQKDADGNLPLVLIPEGRLSCSMMMMVPCGVSCLMQKFGADHGEIDPGLHFLPAWWRIAYVVSKQSNTYNAPVKSCPTQDNVHVDIDVVVVFEIVHASDFVYKMGAANFDDFLDGTVDEAIRQLVRQQSHQEVYNLRGDASEADVMMAKLNRKFENCGVNFSAVKITSVWLPHELAKCLENTTKMQKSMQTIQRKHEFEILQINQDCEMACENIKRRCENALVAESGRKKRAEIDFEQQSVKTTEEGNVQMIRAEQVAEVKLMEANIKLNNTQATLERQRIIAVVKAEEDSNQKRVQGALAGEKKLMQGQTQQEQMECEAESIKAEASAEEEASRCLIEARKHQLDLREKAILQKLAAQGNFNLIGTPADRLIDAMMSGSLGEK